MKINELDNVCAPEKQDRINEFCEWCCEQLGIDVPHLRMAPKNDTTALGYTDMSDGSVTIVVGDRHQMDIMRTLAHELVHVRQMGSYEPDGATGSDDENEANAMAGVLMREWGQNNPDLYTEGVNVEEGKNKGLWHNIHAKRKRGEKPAKKGDKAYPKTLDVDEARLSMKKKKPSPQDRFNAGLKKHGIDLDANLASYEKMMARLSAIDSGAPKTKADESFGKPSPDAEQDAAAAQQKNIDDKYVKTVASNSKAGFYKNPKREGIDKSSDIYQEYLQLSDMSPKELRNMVARANPSDDVRGYDKAGAMAQILRDRHGNRKVNQAMGFGESDKQVDESKTARMMALITALGATYGLEDEARAFADQIKQNIHNAQTAEPNPGRPDPVTPGNMKPGSDRVMRPPVDEIAPALATVGRGFVKGAQGMGSMVKTAATKAATKMAINKVGDMMSSDDEANEVKGTVGKILKGAGAPSVRPKSMREKAVSKSQQRFFGMVDALKKGDDVKGATPDMRKAAKDMSKKDVKDFARTKHKGLPNRVSEAINVQSIKDEVMGAVRSGNAREMKRVSDTIAKRISDLMDLRGTAGKEVDAEIKKALPVLKKAQMMLRQKIQEKTCKFQAE